MIINLTKAHLRETFSYQKIGLFYLSLIGFLVIRLYMFINYLRVVNHPANLFDWVLYSIGGPIGNTRLLNGFFFLILLFIILTFCRSLYEKKPFIYSILLTKSNSRSNWIISIFISQLILSLVSILITLKLTVLIGALFFDFGGASLYFIESSVLSLTDSFLIGFSILCGIGVLNCLLSVQHLFPESDLSNHTISAIILMFFLLLQ